VTKDKKGEKIPSYIGFDLGNTLDSFNPATEIFKVAFDILKEELGTQNDLDKELMGMIKSFDKMPGNWKLPVSYHVTQLFIGGNKDKLNFVIFKRWKEDREVDVVVKGVIYVPGRLLTAIVFPNAEVENEFPHWTLCLGSNWTAKLSNSVLTETCKSENRFKALYDQMASKHPIKEQQVQCASNVTIEVNKK
jgi:hypothetical protein